MKALLILICLTFAQSQSQVHAVTTRFNYNQLIPQMRLINSNDPVDFLHWDEDSSISFDQSAYVFNDAQIGYIEILPGGSPPNIHLPFNVNAFGLQIAAIHYISSMTFEFWAGEVMVGINAITLTNTEEFYQIASNYTTYAFHNDTPFNRVRISNPQNDGSLKITSDSLVGGTQPLPIPEPNGSLLMALGVSIVTCCKRKRMPQT